MTADKPQPRTVRRRSEVRRLTEQLNFRLSSAGKAAVRAAAEECEMQVPDLIRMCLEKQGTVLGSGGVERPKQHAG